MLIMARHPPKAHCELVKTLMCVCVCLPGCECSSTDARLLLTRPVHCVCMLSTRARGEVMMVLMPCRAADTVTGTELSAVLTAVSLRTPVIRKSTVGRMVMLPVRAKRNSEKSFHSEQRIAILMIFILSLNLTHSF